MSEPVSENSQGIDFEQTLDKSVLAEELVAESAKELAAVNDILHKELQSEEPAPAVRLALDRSQAVEEKVNEASEHLSTVNTVLAGELAGRTDLEQKLAAAQADEGTARAAALHDGLTGLPNRTLLDDRLTQGLAHAMREGTTLAVVFIDLDKFKRVNDTYGHAAGDAVLCLVAKRLSESTREVDTVSRRGGDEFLLVLTGVGSKQDVARLSQSILATIAQPCDLSAFGATTEVVVTASAGVAVFPKDGTDGAHLIEAADAAMYVAKNLKAGPHFAS